MSFMRTPLILACVLVSILMGDIEARAQAAHDTSFLSEAERKHYAARLSNANDSAQRAKVKAEMNRLIQTRRLEQRKKKTPPLKPGKRPHN